MWRIILTTASALALSACGAAAPKPAATGPRLEASIAATWPAGGPARQAVFSRDGRLLATADASGLITIRDTRSWSVLERLRHPQGATALAFDPTSSHLFSGGYDGAIRRWDVRTQALTEVFRGPRGTVWTIDISPDGKRLAAAGEDAVIRVWRLDRRSPPARLSGHTRIIWEIRFSPDGTELASGSFDKSVRLWNSDSGRPIKTLTGHTEAIVGLAFTPDGKLLATGGDDSTIRFWSISDGAQLRVIRTGNQVDKVSFSPDGQWLASGGHARGAIGSIWHQVTGGGGEGMPVHLWRTKDAALVATLPSPDDVIYVAFSGDGRWLVTSGEDDRFRLWRLRVIGA